MSVDGLTPATDHAAPGRFATRLGNRLAELLARLRALPWRGLGLASAGLAVSAAGLLLVFWLAGGRHVRLDLGATEAAAAPEQDPQVLQAERRLARLRPRGVWVTIDTYANRLRVYRDDALEREAVISSGSGTVLRDPRTGHEWTFDTPLGEHRVERKARDPVWYKPDWAFVEQGFVPPADGAHRADRDALGDYALYLGDGYLIHGTLFQSLIGRNVTHGCIRAGDTDLRYLFQSVPLGSRVLIY
jgi:L,D-transpeptidase YbiS